MIFLSQKQKSEKKSQNGKNVQKVQIFFLKQPKFGYLQELLTNKIWKQMFDKISKCWDFHEMFGFSRHFRGLSDLHENFHCKLLCFIINMVISTKLK